MRPHIGTLLAYIMYAFTPHKPQIPFSSLVCLTGISVGAVPGVIRRDANSFINVFARDVRAPGAARFSCLYEGLQQPVAGTNSIPLQVCRINFL